MSYVEALLIADARKAGRAVRSASVRHRRIAKRPMAIVTWQLGAEPFTAAAFAWGFGPKDCTVVAPGEPRDRDLAFRELTKVAQVFNPWFEGGHGGEPQIVVPNQGNLTLLGRLGRRLAFLPTDGEQPADPELVRFGKHLRFLADHARVPGQQLVLVLTKLLAEHWVTELSALEVQNLAALDAAIEPPPGKTAFQAAAEAEMDPDRAEIGPLPGKRDDTEVGKLLTTFNERRARSTDEKLVSRLRKDIEQHYTKLVGRAWPLVWRCLARERKFPEASHVERRVERDLEAMGRHLDWVLKRGGHYRTRHTNRQAAFVLSRYEDEEKLVAAEEALDDPLRMLPYLAANQAVGGKVVKVDLEHTEIARVREVSRPRITLETSEQCTVPEGKQFYWTGNPGSKPYTLVSVQHLSKGGSRLVLQHETSGHEQPKKGKDAIFSIHTTSSDGFFQLPTKVPWTHQAKQEPAASIEDSTEVWE